MQFLRPQGLPMVTIQRVTITDEQISMLFWMNILIGGLFALLCLATAPILVTFYHEPRLFWVTIALAAGFVINALGVQHSALLQRHLRFVVLTVIETSIPRVECCNWNHYGGSWLWILGSHSDQYCGASDRCGFGLGRHGMDSWATKA